MRTDRLRPAIALTAVATTAAVALDAPPALRIPLVTVFVLAVPGLVWARTLPLYDIGDRCALAVALSVGAAAILGGVAALAGWWSPPALLTILLALTVAGLAMPAADPLPPTSRIP